MAFREGLPALAGPRDREIVGRSITSLADYSRLYRERSTEMVAADVSPAYLYYPQASAAIAQLVPHARVVMVLRNPVDCVLSMYAMMRRDRREPCGSLLDAFERSEERLANGWEWAWDYQNCFRYAAQVSHYLRYFSVGQLFIRQYEELQLQPERFYRDLTEFLGIAPGVVAQSNQRINSAPRQIDMLRRKRAGRLLCHTARLVNRFAPARIRAVVERRLEAPAFALSPTERRVLVEHFADDIVDLSRLLAWDLSTWLEVPDSGSLSELWP